MKNGGVVEVELIERKIFVVRGYGVIPANHLAKLYDVETKVLMQAVKRNIERFPEDFMFQLTGDEAISLRSQFVTLDDHGRGKHAKYLPYVFTEHGVAMLSSVLGSKKAIQVNILIIRAFVRLRDMLATHRDLSIKITDLEKKYENHNVAIQVVFEEIRKLMEPPPEKPKRRIGFRSQ